MPEKALGASGSSSEVGGFPQTLFQPVLNRHHQGPASRLHSHTKTDFRRPACCRRTWPPSDTPHTRSPLLLLESLSRAGGRTSSADLDPGAAAALQMEQRQFPPFSCGNLVFLIASILGLERALSRTLYSFPPSGEVEREVDSAGKRQGRKRFTDIFRDMGIKQTGSF